jgi:DNA-binding PucR family transcriptional regulator
VQRGFLDEVPVTWCQDHLLTMWLFTDTSLVDELAGRTLGPLAELSTTQRVRLSETLLAWLKTRGNVSEVAQLLDVHPQTVRNRMHQLDGLFGDRLNDPNDRFEMEIALRALEGLARTGTPSLAEPALLHRAE